MNTRQYAAIAAALVCAAASAQSLSTEVVVDRTVLPAERAASRPATVTPALVLPQATTIDLATSDYTALSPLTRAYSPLSPVAAPGLSPLSPYRGYAVIGYGPLYNLGLSAGYRAINTGRTRLGIHAQFDGESYKGVDTDDKMKYNGARIGADLNTAVGASSHLIAGVSVGYSTSATPAFTESQSLVNGRIGALWLSSVGKLSYKAGASVEFDSYGELKELYYGSLPEIHKPRQQTYGFELGAAYPLSGVGRLGLDVEGEFMSTTDCETLGAVGLTPHYTLRTADVSARIGLKVDFATGGEGSKVHVMPDVHIAWTPSGSPVAVYADATGGTRLNTFASLRQVSPYLRGAGCYGRSDVPFDIGAGIVVGPVSGFTARIYGGYAKADEWLMMSDLAPIMPFVATDISGWRAGVELGYDFGRLVTVKAGAQIASSGDSHAWYQWRDRARMVVDASLAVHPVERLDITLGYQWRDRRRAADVHGFASLGCVSDLSASAAYGINDAVSVFARGENLFGRRYSVLPDVDAQGAAGMLGISVKF
ncbi:MAG: hypothetical protein Q4C34_05065 [Bacteroidales bacterium]|nr:hypothetical protein [Bacteroidales bacterium]